MWQLQISTHTSKSFNWNANFDPIIQFIGEIFENYEISLTEALQDIFWFI